MLISIALYLIGILWKSKAPCSTARGSNGCHFELCGTEWYQRHIARFHGHAIEFIFKQKNRTSVKTKSKLKSMSIRGSGVRGSSAGGGAPGGGSSAVGGACGSSAASGTASSRAGRMAAPTGQPILFVVATVFLFLLVSFCGPAAAIGFGFDEFANSRFHDGPRSMPPFRSKTRSIATKRPFSFYF